MEDRIKYVSFVHTIPPFFYWVKYECPGDQNANRTLDHLGKRHKEKSRREQTLETILAGVTQLNTVYLKKGTPTRVFKV
jgi:hypothetical protein